jgi:hypothetical protein
MMATVARLLEEGREVMMARVDVGGRLRFVLEDKALLLYSFKRASVYIYLL